MFRVVSVFYFFIYMIFSLSSACAMIRLKHTERSLNTDNILQKCLYRCCLWSILVLVHIHTYDNTRTTLTCRQSRVTATPDQYRCMFKHTSRELIQKVWSFSLAYTHMIGEKPEFSVKSTDIHSSKGKMRNTHTSVSVSKYSRVYNTHVHTIILRLRQNTEYRR